MLNFAAQSQALNMLSVYLNKATAHKFLILSSQLSSIKHNILPLYATKISNNE